MDILSINDVKGDFVNLKVANNKHIGDKNLQKQSGDPVVSSFADMFNKALNDVNDMEIKSTELTNQMAVNPESVNIHDVQIAAEEAEMAVMFTKGIVDRVIRAYKEITNLR
ncbi:MAG: flagellar hook-basal body complex protein FliE [Spirochaetes bacterium GWD1_27_9]|nr:MAG: flagellar hook-basal body complex protein FliE [Spirochaetes bacterium GWB1_27_13]OHD25342.1 MAG: flagellar hook-basal body complex protein FliE [Spirochaetes bacterium GWC1_27_15]OHD31128.1 MAG: flagellar hook-basal body complex protein FliE [Spirochaetes bacterium GWD1_27_9]